MSSLDPLASIVAQAVANAENAIAEAAINIGVSADVLQAQISVGDQIAAKVLPAQNGSDYVSFLGQTVAAQLPPGVHPGESLLLQVTGFAGQAILVRNLGPIDPNNPPVTIDVNLPEASTSGAPTAVLTTRPPAATPTPGAASAPAASARPQSVAPPPLQSGIPQQPQPASAAPFREIIIAASVRPNPGAPATPPSIPVRPGSVAPSSGNDVELRMAVNRTTLPPVGVPRAPSAPPPATPPVASSRPPGLPPNVVAAPAVSRTPSPPSAPVTPQAAFLARLHVPLSAATLIAARLVDDAARAITSSYDRLDAVLARANVSDPRVASLRSLLSFVGKMDLRNASALPEQISAFISNVVGGAESKVAQIVRALTAVAEEALPQAESAVNTSQPATVPAPIPPSAAAVVAERIVALDYNVKSAILSLLQNPPREFGPEATQALSSALGSTTALQLNVLDAQRNDPTALAIPLPAYFYEGGKPAQLRIDRDAPGGKTMDADNFRVAFVLDTKTMGTVAIDLQTVGRAVSVNVKTERPSAAERFRSTFSDLRGRLEQLRYRVAATGADVARTPEPQAPPAPAPSPAPRRGASNVDLQA